MRIVVAFFVAIALALAVWTLQIGVPTADAAAPLTVQAGGSTKDGGVQALQFFPAVTTVNAGDSVTWSDGSLEPHTVSFGKSPNPPGSEADFVPVGGNSYDGNGFLNSGLLLPGASFAVKFTTPGTYDYVCLLHTGPNGGMMGRVVVQAAGSAYPAEQASYAAAADPRLATTLTNGSAAWTAQWATGQSNGNGTATYNLTAGVGDGSFALFRFGSDKITIRAGDTVKWTQADPLEIHTITFRDNGKDVPLLQPDLTFNPAAVLPAGGPTYSGVGYTNSGILLPPGAPGPNTFALTFTTPGTYTYECLLHDDSGMTGTIQVLPAAPQAPVPFAQKSGHVDAGGDSATYTFDYPGDESVYTVAQQVTPDNGALLQNAGFSIYGPGGALYGNGGAQPGLVPNVSANVISKNKGRHRIRVYDNDRYTPIDYQLSLFRGPKEGQ